MKKISNHQKLILDRLSKQRFSHRLTRASKRYDPIRGIRHVHPPANPQARQYVDIEVPETLCLDRAFEETAEFLQMLRRRASLTTLTIKLDFKHCKNIKPTALLLLLAEVHYARLVRGQHVLTGTYPRDHALLRRMCAMGFFKLLGIKSPVESSKSFPLEYIPFRSDNKRAKHTTKALREGLFGDKIKMQMRARKQLQRGVSEAMLNAITHAYPLDSVRHPAIKNRWWICGHYHHPSKKVWVMFCDLGVGIPRTLPRRYPMEHIRRVLNTLPGVPPDDGEMVYAAMELGRTRTALTHRGKGLNDLRFFIEQAGAGDLEIFSSRGYYQYRGNNSEKRRTLPVPIRGTLIKWSVPIDKVAILDGDHEHSEDD